MCCCPVHCLLPISSCSYCSRVLLSSTLPASHFLLFFLFSCAVVLYTACFPFPLVLSVLMCCCPLHCLLPISSCYYLFSCAVVLYTACFPFPFVHTLPMCCCSLHCLLQISICSYSSNELLIGTPLVHVSTFFILSASFILLSCQQHCATSVKP